MFGVTEVIQLKRNGAHIPVNDENKVCYILPHHASHCLHTSDWCLSL